MSVGRTLWTRLALGVQIAGALLGAWLLLKVAIGLIFLPSTLDGRSDRRREGAKEFFAVAGVALAVLAIVEFHVARIARQVGAARGQVTRVGAAFLLGYLVLIGAAAIGDVAPLYMA